MKKWNQEIFPQLRNTTSTKSKTGIYLELKDYPWLLEDTDTHLDELLFDHYESNKQLWKSVILDQLCNAKRTDEYRPPPLVVQSFEAKVLESFSEQWSSKFNGDSSSSAEVSQTPVPPLVLLVPIEKCFEEKFWFEMDDSWRDFLSGVGPDKECLYYNWREFMDRAFKLDLAVHPWTERPELEFVGGEENIAGFDSELAETRHLFCDVGVHGVLTEDVGKSVMAANTPCPEKVTHDSKDDSIKTSGNTSNQANLYVGMLSFVTGFIIAMLVGHFFSIGREGRQREETQVPTTEAEYDNDNLEML